MLHFTYLDHIFNSSQPNSMPPPPSSQIHLPFPTQRQDFTYRSYFDKGACTGTSKCTFACTCETKTKWCVCLGKVLTFSREYVTNFNQRFTSTSDFLPLKLPNNNIRFENVTLDVRKIFNEKNIHTYMVVFASQREMTINCFSDPILYNFRDIKAEIRK